MASTSCIQGAYGPLRPPTKCKVPLWMASNLKLKKKCHIVPPVWLNTGTSVHSRHTVYLALSPTSGRSFTIDFLQERLTEETTSPSFSEMPFRFAEVAKTLLDVWEPAH